jgi:hypothetical protein
MLMSLILSLTVQSCSAADASDSAVVVKTESVKSTFSGLEQYLKQMHGPISQYLKIMLDLVPLEEPPEASDFETLKADKAQNLIVSLGKIAPPASATETHGELKESLNAVVAFVSAGGLSKVDFSKALQIAQQMHDCSDRFHAVVLEEIAANNLSKASDPFLVQQVKPDSVPFFSVRNGSGSQFPSSDASMLKEDSAGGKHFSTGGYGQAQSNFERSSMINGVDDPMGMSGLFNGLGGTGTNGLVDGMGFSSGLNGYVNGAGVSSGTSGMFNDMNVMSPSSGNKSGY